MREWISGRNPVFEALSAGRRHFFRLRIAQGVQETGRLQEIISLCRKCKLPVERLPRPELDAIAPMATRGSPWRRAPILTAICRISSIWLPGTASPPWS